MEPVRDPADLTKVYKQIKKNGRKQEISRYPDAVKRIVVGKMIAVYNRNCNNRRYQGI